MKNLRYPLVSTRFCLSLKLGLLPLILGLFSHPLDANAQADKTTFPYGPGWGGKTSNCYKIGDSGSKLVTLGTLYYAFHKLTRDELGNPNFPPLRGPYQKKALEDHYASARICENSVDSKAVHSENVWRYFTQRRFVKAKPIDSPKSALSHLKLSCELAGSGVYGDNAYLFNIGDSIFIRICTGVGMPARGMIYYWGDATGKRTNCIKGDYPTLFAKVSNSGRVAFNDFSQTGIAYRNLLAIINIAEVDRNWHTYPINLMLAELGYKGTDAMKGECPRIISQWDAQLTRTLNCQRSGDRGLHPMSFGGAQQLFSAFPKNAVVSTQAGMMAEARILREWLSHKGHKPKKCGKPSKWVDSANFEQFNKQSFAATRAQAVTFLEGLNLFR